MNIQFVKMKGAPMKKFAIIYGSMKTDLQKRAVEELTSILLDYTLVYPICIQYEEKLVKFIFAS